MTKRNKLALLLVFVALFAGLLFWYFFGLRIGNDADFAEDEVMQILEQQPESENEELPADHNPPEKISAEVETVNQPEKTVKKTTFISQAPTGNWSDPVFQNGCEEASVLMAMGWVQGKKSITAEEAIREIEDMSAYEKEIFGSYVDTSVEDTASFMRKYFKYAKIETRENITAKDIINSLADGSLVIVPMYGKALGNPHFTPPGPDEHMLVVIGYDAKSDEFITNDPGTKFGEEYRYSSKVFMKAIWAYPTSPGPVPYPGVEKAAKAMIVVHPQE